MKSMSVKDAKYRFGQFIDMARAKPVVIGKHGRPVVVSVEAWEKLHQRQTKHRRSEGGSADE